jgi:hypothetical protein
MLERLSLSTPLDEFTERRQFSLGQRALELEIKLDPFAREDVRKQMLRIQTRILDATLFEVAGRGL